MTRTDPSSMLQQQIFEFQEETFEKVRGIFLDGGTSLFETIDSLNAEQASISVTPDGTSIAAHVEHIRFYLHVNADYIQGRPLGKIDWRTSWRDNVVSAGEWEELKASLRQEHQAVLNIVQGISDWSTERHLGGAMGIITHTAYHLGAIRQILHAAKRQQ